MTGLDSSLTKLGAALERAAASDLDRPRARPRRAVLLAAAVAGIVVLTGAGFAAVRLISGGDVAASLPAGTLSLAGTEPTCTVVRPKRSAIGWEPSSRRSTLRSM